MKRFYKAVSIEPADAGWQVRLDGRAIRTPAGAQQIIQAKPLAEAMAQEWADQGEEIDTAAFPLRDLADYTIDMVRHGRPAVIAEILAYGGTDTLCYRGDEGEALYARQFEMWEPLLREAEQRWDVHFTRIIGILHTPQPDEILARMEAALATLSEFELAAMRMLASLSASLVIALAAIRPDADAEVLWSAANLEEDWQAELWGMDSEAQALRETRFAAFKLAMRFASLSRLD